MQPLGESTNISAFLGKLWKIVNDPVTDHLICWSAAGNSFIIQNQAQFWYELLPLYYKHNNMSSFVRQLNMYGFHKMSTVENGTMDSDKDEIQFYHKYFQKGHPELLRNIKRKVTVTKSENHLQNVLKDDDLSKVLSDVKHLYGRQSNVDSQLGAMKQENAVLWRELAMLRQKHLKQQQIVNKLIQFLVTFVQPSPSSRMGVGVKRRMPLMLHESPSKKLKSKKTLRHDSSDHGPIIHELDSEIEISPEEMFEVTPDGSIRNPQVVVTSPSSQIDSPKSASVLSGEENVEDGLQENIFVVTNSPSSSVTSQPNSIKTPLGLSSGRNELALPENIFEDIDPADLIAENEDIINESDTLQTTTTRSTNKGIFLNPTGGNTLLSNISNGSYNSNVLNSKLGKKMNYKSPENTNTLGLDSNSDMQVATRISTGEELDGHLESTQSDIDQLKDILKGCNGLDANALLGLFNDETPSYGLSYNTNELNKCTPLDAGSADPMVSGTELATYGINLMDFNDLLDESLDGQDNQMTTKVEPEGYVSSMNTPINTPMVVKTQPTFPNLDKDL